MGTQTVKVKYNWRLDAKEVERLYQEGYSCEQVGKMLGASRQAVWEKLKHANVPTRAKRFLPFQTFQGVKYTLRNTGYYARTNNKRTMMHREVWESYNGKIPPNHDIHHVNHNRADNRIDNLELYTKSEHARKFATGNNQFTKNRPKSNSKESK